MKTVYQDSDEPECGAASVAMLGGVTLKQARKMLFSADAKPTGIRRIREVLGQNFKLQAETSKARTLSQKVSLKDLAGNALVNGDVLIEGEWKRHWMVWDFDARCLRDPLGFILPLRVTSATVFR